MDQALKRCGNAAVELVLITPLFLALLAFGGILGGYSRLIAHGPSVADDILRFADGTDAGNYESQRQLPWTLSQVKRHWSVQNPAGEVALTIQALDSESDGISMALPTVQSDTFTEDHLGLDEEVTRLLLDSLTATVDQLGQVSFNAGWSPATAWFNAYGDRTDLDGSVALLESRSTHRSVFLEMEGTPWLRSLIPFGDSFIASFDIEAHRRTRPITGPDDFHFFDDADTFHDHLEELLIGVGEEDATLDPSPHWLLHTDFWAPN